MSYIKVFRILYNFYRKSGRVSSAEVSNLLHENAFKTAFKINNTVPKPGPNQLSNPFHEYPINQENLPLSIPVIHFKSQKQ